MLFHEPVELALELLPDLRAGGGTVGVRIGGRGVLARVGGAGGLRDDALGRFVDGARIVRRNIASGGIESSVRVPGRVVALPVLFLEG